MKDVLDTLEHLSTAAGDRHLLLTGTLNDQFSTATSRVGAFSSAAARELVSDMINVAQLHLSEEETRIEDALRAMSEDAHRRAKDHLSMSDSKFSEVELTELFSQPEDMSGSYLHSELVAQINRDVNQLRRHYRNASLRVVMKSDMSDMTREQASRDVMVEEMISRKKLWFNDRAGRKIPSQKHIRRLWRMVLRDHWVAVYMSTLARFSVEEARVWHMDPSHRSYGLQLSVTDPDWGLENINEVFHPNANALPVAPAYLEVNV